MTEYVFVAILFTFSPIFIPPRSFPSIFRFWRISWNRPSTSKFYRTFNFSIDA